MDHPKDIGDRAALAVMLALRESGYAISVPFGENTRYDLIIDDGRRLARVQCKTGRLREGAVRFASCSCYGHHRNPETARRPYAGQIEYFAVHCPETASVYLVDAAEVPNTSSVALRVAPPRNNQRKRIRLADEKLLARVEVVPTTEPGATAGAG